MPKKKRRHHWSRAAHHLRPCPAGRVLPQPRRGL